MAARNGKFVLSLRALAPEAKMETFAQPISRSDANRAEQQIKCRPQRSGIHLHDAAQLDFELIGDIPWAACFAKLLQDGLEFRAGFAPSFTPGPELDGSRVVYFRILSDL